MYLQCLTLTSTLLGRYIAIKPDYLAKWILCYSESQNKISCEIFNIRFQGVLVWNDISDGIKLLPLKSFKKNHKLILSLVPMVIWGSLYSSQFFVNLFLLIIIAYCWVQVKLLLLFLLALGFLLWLVIKEVHLVLAFDIIFPEKSTGMPDSCPKILSIKDTEPGCPTDTISLQSILGLFKVDWLLYYCVNLFQHQPLLQLTCGDATWVLPAFW